MATIILVYFYLVYFPESGKIAKIRNVKLTNKFKNKPKEPNNPDKYDNFDQLDGWQVRAQEADALPQTLPQDEIIDPPVLPEKENIDPVFNNTNIVETETVDNQTGPPGQGKHNLRYPARQTRRPPHLDDSIVENDLDDNDLRNYNIDYCCATSVYPSTYEEAVKSQDSKKWLEAMSKEMKSLRENNTYTLTKLTTSQSN